MRIPTRRARAFVGELLYRSRLHRPLWKNRAVIVIFHRVDGLTSDPGRSARPSPRSCPSTRPRATARSFSTYSSVAQQKTHSATDWPGACRSSSVGFPSFLTRARIRDITSAGDGLLTTRGSRRDREWNQSVMRQLGHRSERRRVFGAAL